MKIEVNKDTSIGELVTIDQGVVPILMAVGMHCIGCPASQMETIEEAAMVHGIDPQSLVDEINDYLNSEHSDEDSAAETV
jgi:hybrid cluster-associated redox disulfide protein